MSVNTPATVAEPNPLREGLEQERVPDASVLVIFGAAGDLTHRKLIPALYSLAHDGLLPGGQAIVGFARSDFSDESFRHSLREACDKFARTRPTEDAVWDNLAKSIFYIQGAFDDPAAYDRLAAKLAEIDQTCGSGG